MSAVSTVPPAASVGLDLFAAAWIERFTGLGGDLYAYSDGRILTYFPEPGVGRRPEECEYLRAKTDGRFRELTDLLRAVPGGRDAVLAHLREWPFSVHSDGVSTFQP
ncbi:hypothetical protein ACFSCW_03470 [Sphingomonas tabacisoli]|uniref:Uncharacterized protein n=1 Tax=Sphingomonas tabacisoli TaxID=2249466 RepID=A0ABW4HZZ5_9SPHN